jgi:hypothetical protein
MEIKLLNPPNVVEKYKDTLGSPDGWEKKLFEMRRGFPVPDYYPSYDVFDPMWTMPNKLNSKECNNLAELKDRECKKKVLTKCNTNTPSDQLQANHNRMMICRNIRAIENKANCHYDKGWLKNDDIGHQKEIVDIGNGAFNCLKEYKERRKKSEEKKHRLRSISRRRKANLNKSTKRKSKSRKSSRKRTPSRKMK